MNPEINNHSAVSLTDRVMQRAAQEVIDSKTMTVREAAEKYNLDQAILVHHIPVESRRV